ncbi:MAG: hypothetical protein GY696_02220 [Gammaproteobacteria bacterium]|nr:hypothetical protein [Gammaproteobacteria bacterium]
MPTIRLTTIVLCLVTLLATPVLADDLFGPEIIIKNEMSISTKAKLYV